MNGTGSKKARIVFVGEAPGKQEDIKGEPFVGRAGKFLDSTLEKAGLERSKLFITNVTRCRPPNNRKPNDDEVEKCLPYLVEELESIKPAFVIAMGALAIKALTGMDDKISTLIGRRIEICCGDVRMIAIPCYHPSAAMRNRRMRELFEEIVSEAALISR